MNLNRRQFLVGTGGLLLASTLGGCQWQQTKQWIVSTASDHDNNYFAIAVDAMGNLINKVPLPQRGHDSLALPNKPGHALIFARRPDRFMLEVNFITGEVTHAITSQEDTHFYGHGALSSDNQYLFTTENEYTKGNGLIVVRDTSNYQVVERYESGGIGPHELVRLPGQNTLAICNGGIKTHPDYDRIKLNLDDMRPNLSYMDIQSGKIIASYGPPHHQQSIRHMDVREDGKVFVGVQYQGRKNDIVPLVYAHHGEEQLVPFTAPEQQWRDMNQYTASLKVKDNLLAISCPRGNHICFWHADQHEFIEQQAMTDAAGISIVSSQLIASNGLGKVRQYASSTQLRNNVEHEVYGLRFDNHMTTINAA